MMAQHILVSAWLALFTPRNNISMYLVANPQLTHDIQAAADRHNVPATLLFVLGVNESGLGSNPRARMEWGVPNDQVRHSCRRDPSGCGQDRLHGQLEVGARILERAWTTCVRGTHALHVRAAARYYRTGQCGSDRSTVQYPFNTYILYRRLERAARRISAED